MARLAKIGVTALRKMDEGGTAYAGVPDAYVKAIAQAGGIPFLIPVGLNETQLSDVFVSIDGLLFSGGGDISPRFYGLAEDKYLMSVDEERDSMELFLARKAINEKKPFFGICRGLQVVNVALGGTLYTHIPEQCPSEITHRQPTSASKDLIAHSVRVVAESTLAEIVGVSELAVNSRHHQGIKQLATGLKVSALAPDGMIEAVEMPDHPFGIAVQWHPENLTSDRAMLAIFVAFVNACKQRV